VRLTELRIRNFLSVGAEQSVSLDNAGLVLITGENKDSRSADSNGAGKSTILEAVVWCLWGTTVRNLKADEVVNRVAKKNCRVSLKIVDDTTDPPVEYEVVRTRKDKASKKAADLHLIVAGNSATAGTNSDTQELVNTVIGMEQSTFTQSVMLSAGGRSFCEMTDSEQKSVLDDILQLDSLQQAKDAVKTRLFEAETKMAVVSSSLTKVEADCRTLADSVLAFKQKENEFSARQHARVIEQMKLKATVAAQAEEYEDSYDLSEAVDDLDRVKKEFLETQGKDDELSQQLMDVMAKSNIGRVDLEKKLSVLEVKTRELTNCVGSINELAGADCPTCRQHVHPDTADEFLGKWEDQLSKIDAIHGKVVGLLAGSRAEADKETRSIGKKRDALRADIISLQNQMNGAIEKVKKAEHAVDQVFACVHSLKNFDTTIENIRAEENPYKHLLSTTERSLEDALEEKKKLTLKRKALEIETKHLQFWSRGFGNQGVKSYMLDNVIPFLTDRAQRYADILSGGDLKISFSTQTTTKGGKLKEQFQVKVVNSQGADVYKGNSAGEKRRSDIAVGWALGDLAATRARKPIRFKALDEPFESLDESGEDAVIKLLYEVLPEYETIMCVTHSSHLKSQFPKELTVVKEGGYSKIKV
jgi:DNA repair exonuclease SbcCD ATPase subunit